MRFIDLFAGLGGWTSGLRKAGFEHVCGVEQDPYAAEAYKRNHGAVLCSDVCQTSRSHLDAFVKGRKLNMIVASPPCTSFSNQGCRKSGDPRDYLYREAIRIALLYQTDYILFENVMGIISKKDKGRSFLHIMVADLELAGYETDAAILNAAAYGAPQNRRRLFILGCRKSHNPGFPKPLKHYDASVGKCLLALSKIPAHYLHSEERVKSFYARTAAAKARGAGWKMQILDASKPSFTLTSRYHGNYGYYALVKVTSAGRESFRMLTPRECACIMGFTAKYILFGANEADVYKQINNAVCPPVAYRIGLHIKNCHKQ